MVALFAFAPLISLSLPPPIPKCLNYYTSRTISTRTSPRNLFLSAQFNGGSGDGNGANGDAGLDERRRSPLIDLRRWRDILSVDPENIAAVGLTGLLAWASVQALFQLLFISLAIVLAALKYSFIVTLLLFILITLLFRTGAERERKERKGTAILRFGQPFGLRSGRSGWRKRFEPFK